MTKIFVSTAPFGEVDPKPIHLLKDTGWDFELNPYDRKLSPEEVGKLAADCDGLIAGTEDIDIVLKTATKLKIVSRVGIGLDSVPLKKCKELGIAVTYTPDAVTMAVAELTLGTMISLTRHVCYADRQIRQGNWKRKQGKRIGKSIIGIIGFGRVGTSVADLLAPFRPEQILVNDIIDKDDEIKQFQEKGLNIKLCEKTEIYQTADIISLHVPLTSMTNNMIDKNTLSTFKPDAHLLNLSRGGIVNEEDLFHVLSSKLIGGAALDCFTQEPYQGNLKDLDNVLLTQHMGSCSFDCRAAMELEATKDIIRFFKGEKLHNPVQEDEIPV